MENPTLRWIEVSSASYTRYDNDLFREAILARGAVFTNASQVYADSCAEHVLAMMLALARQLLPSYETQLGDRSWPYQLSGATRRASLARQTVVLLGFGAIGRRLAALLAPFGARIYAVRRRIRSEPGVRVVSEEDLTKVLSEADHVVNVLPGERDDAQLREREADLMLQGRAPGSTTWAAGPRSTRTRSSRASSPAG